MSITATEYRLHVNFANHVIGTLHVDSSTNLLNLKYNQYWQQTGFAISPALPLDNKHTSQAAYNYLDNALPEGKARELLAEKMGVSEKNIYPQIRAIGNDLAGAFTFLSIDTHKINTEQTVQSSFRPLESNELQTRLDQKDNIGLLIWDNKPRLSMAGVQDKLNVFINEHHQMGFGDGALCSTHILKFEKASCPNLVLNEYFCMKLSTAVGLPTADIEFTRFGSHPTLIVKRFDRKYTPSHKRVMRRHVIDGCQALNLPRDYKYERNLGDSRDVQHIRDGASLARLFKFCKSMSSPVESTLWLINWQLFNLIINNYDSHGKNVSIFFDKNNTQFTPAYDLVNIAMYPQFQQVLAMAVGDEFEPNDIHAYQLADFAETCKIDKKLLSRQLDSLAIKVINTLTGNSFISHITQGVQFSDNDQHYLSLIKDNILARANYLRSQSPDIATIEV